MSLLIHDLCDWMRIPHSPHPHAEITTVRHGTTQRPRIVLAGGSGFLGGLLRRHFEERGWEVAVLSRTPEKEPAFSVRWDGHSLGSWVGVLEGADALVNLCGRSVNCRYHSANRGVIMNSRLESTRVLGEAVARCSAPPKVWINLSTATIYRHTHGPAWDESGEIGETPEAKDAFSIEAATAWERVFFDAPTVGTRKVALRSAMVPGWSADANNVYRVLARLVRLGLGGRMGDGRQFVSWVHEHDFCRAVEFILEHKALTGVVNVTAPNPLPNTDLMRTLRRLLGRPAGLPAPRWMLELGALVLRTETELILKSRRVVPGCLLAAGFPFCYPTLDEAVGELEARNQQVRSDAPGRGEHSARLRTRHAASG